MVSNLRGKIVLLVNLIFFASFGTLNMTKMKKNSVGLETVNTKATLFAISIKFDIEFQTCIKSTVKTVMFF